MLNAWIRINGNSHSFLRELGCDCKRCTTINYSLPVPTGLSPFSGWDDPPFRAHTSASILLSDEKNLVVENHILIDSGAGVIDSLVCSKINGLDNIKALLLTHWHPDHTLSLNQLCESLRRNAKRKGTKFNKIQTYTTKETYAELLKRGYNYEFNKFLEFKDIWLNLPLEFCKSPLVKITALPVIHGSVKGAVIFIAEIDNKKIIFAWDIDVPDPTNINTFNENIKLLENPDILFIAINAWKAIGTGHTSYQEAIKYINLINAKKVYALHLSGHEDGKGNPGYGWSDQEWESKLSVNDINIAKTGMLIKV